MRHRPLDQLGSFVAEPTPFSNNAVGLAQFSYLFPVVNSPFFCLGKVTYMYIDVDIKRKLLTGLLSV